MNTRLFWPSTFVLFGVLVLSARAQGPPPTPQGRGGRGNITLPDGAGKVQVEAYARPVISSATSSIPVATRARGGNS